MVAVIVAASLAGPPIIERTTGYTYDYIPSDPELLKSLPPFTAPDGSFSWTHPMGTDTSGRDLLARVLLGGRISLMVGLISTFVSLLIGTGLRRDRRLPRRPRRRGDDAHRRRPLLDPVHDGRHRAAVALRQQHTARPAGAALPRPRRRVVADHGAHRARAGHLAQEQEFILAARATGVSTVAIICRGTWCRTRSVR